MRMSAVRGISLALAGLLAGCSGSLVDSIGDALPQPEPQYKSSTNAPPLEIPPDLSSAGVRDT